MVRTIVVVDYDPTWSVQYERAAAELRPALAVWLADLQHVGSTSVPGLAAKPTIDILAGVHDLAAFDAEGGVAAVAALGYEYIKKHEAVLPFRRYFRKTKPDGNHTHHLHLAEITHPWWAQQVLFRDYLRAHPTDRDAYAQLKREIAPRFVHDAPGYNSAKNDLIHQILARADLWRKTQQP